MIKKATTSIMILVLMIIASTVTVSAETITHTDDTNDVLDGNLENVSRQNIDIEKVTAVKDGRNVEVKLKVADGGTIQKSSLSYMYGYNIIVLTTHEMYTALYTGLDLSSLTDDEKEGATDDELALYESLACFIVTAEGDSVDVISYSGQGENELSIKFKLLDSNEEIIALSAETAEQTSTQDFYDEFTGEELLLDVQETYDSKTGELITFTGELDEGTASDYNWVWYLEETNTVLTGVNPSHTFKIPDIYEGVVYSYDSNGDYGVGYFSVNVTGKAINGGGGNGSPGFEIIIFFAAIAILVGAIIVAKRK